MNGDANLTHPITQLPNAYKAVQPVPIRDSLHSHPPPREQYMDQIVNLVMFAMDRTVAQSYRICVVQVVTKRVVSDNTGLIKVVK